MAVGGGWMVLGQRARHEDGAAGRWFRPKLVVVGHWLKHFLIRDGGGFGSWAVGGRARWLAERVSGREEEEK